MWVDVIDSPEIVQEIPLLLFFFWAFLPFGWPDVESRRAGRKGCAGPD